MKKVYIFSLFLLIMGCDGFNDEETEALIRTFYNNHRDNTTIDRGTYNGSAIGNKNVYDIDANDSVSSSGDGMMMARVFGYWQNGANAIPTTEFLNPHDGGPAVWNGSTWDYGIVTTITGPLNITGLLNINI